MLRTSFAILVVVLVCSMGPVSCGSSEGIGSCDMGMVCFEYTGYGWDVTRVGERCRGFGGEYIDGDCPDEDLIGTCTYDQGGEDEYVEHFYAPYFDAPAGNEACDVDNGIWRPE